LISIIVKLYLWCKKITEDCVPADKVAYTEHNVPKWSDYAKENYANARSAFLEWIYDGKPRSGDSHTLMCTTRAKFKLVLRYCRRHIDQMKADARAKDLLEANGNSKLWKGISIDMSGKVTRFANKVGNAVGEQEVCDM